MDDVLTIGQLARAAGVNVETVRYYERRGLLAEPPRTASGYRQYSEADLWRLQFIARAKELGFTLTEITEVIGLDERSVGGIVAAALAKIDAIDARQRELAEMRCRLLKLVSVCRSDAIDDCLELDPSATSPDLANLANLAPTTTTPAAAAPDLVLAPPPEP